MAMAEILAALNWVWIPLLIIGGFFGIIFVGFPLLIFAVSLIEKVYLRELVPRPAGQRPTDKDEFIRAAEVRGFRLIGTFDDRDSSIKHGIVTLMLSGNDDTLIALVHGKLGGRVKLYSRLVNGNWVVTANFSGSADPAGVEDEQTLPNASLETLLYYHRQRLQSVPAPVNPFRDNELTRDLLDHSLNQAHRLVAMRRVRWVSEDPPAIRCRLRGALANVKGHFSNLLEAMRQQERAKSIAQEAAGHFAANPPWLSAKPSTASQPHRETSGEKHSQETV